MIEEKGNMKFCDANDANIPVDIWLTSQKDGTWTLTAANYIPRKGLVVQETYKAVSSSREELAKLVKKHILPLYETAVKKLNAISEGTAEDLYYWKHD